MENHITIDNALTVEVFTEDECVINIVQSGYNRNQWIYKASQLTEEGATQRVYDRVSKIEGRELTNMSISYINRSEGIKNNLRLNNYLNLSETERDALSNMTYGASQCLKGDTDGAVDNFVEIMRGIERIPGADEIAVYNAIKSHAPNGEDLQYVPYIVRHIIDGSTSLKKKFRSSSAPYKIHKLLKAIREGQDESVLISIADTGNKIPTASSKADRQRIKELEEENEFLKRKIRLFESSISMERVRTLVHQIKEAVRSLKAVGGNPELMEALRLLGVDATVNEDELKKAYRAQVSIHHPDKQGDADMFRDIVNANKTVSNFIKRITNG